MEVRMGVMRANVARHVLAGAVAVLCTCTRAAGQAPSSTSAGPPLAAPPHLGEASGARMWALLEVTIFHVDVLTLEVRVDEESAVRLREIAEGRTYSEALADSVAEVVLGAREAWSVQVLQRDVGMGRLVRGMSETVERAAEAGFVSRSYAESFEGRAPRLFGFLAEEGARDGDAIVLHSSGDTVRTVYRAAGGEVRLDGVVVSPEARRASVPAFFAPGTPFRRRLVESLLMAAARPSG